ncbi:cell division FtsK/SpoIIIE [Candida maltosa Xu316]|uniref:Cell division FtsK/SpoIIIE n=1 Tax=Candida maltosa (strain Xu316) TaxID=1245528 RepID=M3JCL9_CANMX|nr:cell division FtsK/SpoIIIE [Candida maltosa Xu316]
MYWKLKKWFRKNTDNSTKKQTENYVFPPAGYLTPPMDNISLLIVEPQPFDTLDPWRPQGDHLVPMETLPSYSKQNSFMNQVQ